MKTVPLRDQETLEDRLGYCRRMLHIHGVISSAENERAKERMEKRHEMRQCVLDDVRNGQTLGDVARAHEITLAAVCGVLERNIQSRTFLAVSEASQPSEGE